MFGLSRIFRKKKSRDSYHEKGETVFCKKCYRVAICPVRESVGNASTSNDQIRLYMQSR